MLDCNPFVPLNPGEPGLIFASRHEILSDPPWTVFVKRTNASPAVWSYQGEYGCTLCGTMTVEEFTSQTQKVFSFRSLLEYQVRLCFSGCRFKTDGHKKFMTQKRMMCM